MLDHTVISLDQKQVHYWVRNPHGRRTVVALHGFKGNHKGLTELSQHLADYRVILLDLPGYGLSDPLASDHSLVAYARFIDRLTAELNLDRFSLLGHSYGGSIGLVYASMFKERLSDLVLICPTVTAGSWSGWLAKANLGIASSLPERWRGGWLASPLIEAVSDHVLATSSSWKRRQEIAAQGMRNMAEQRPEVVRQSLQSYLTTPFGRYASKIGCPTLIVAGSLDIVAPPRSQVKLASVISDCHLKLLEGEGHLAPLERPGTVARAVQDFWELHWGGRTMAEREVLKEGLQYGVG